MKAVLVAAALLTAVLGASCGKSSRADTVSGKAPARGIQSTPYSPFTGHGSAVSEPPLSAHSSNAARPSDPSLTQYLLGPSDMPGGYSTPAPTSFSDDDKLCNTTDLTDVAGLKEASAYAEVEYEESELGPLVNHAVGVFTTDGARAAMDSVKRELSACSSWVSQHQDGTSATYSIAALSFPLIGDQTFAVRISTRDVPVFGLAQIDAVFFRRGRAVEFLFDISLGTQEAPDLETLVRKADAKLQASPFR